MPKPVGSSSRGAASQVSRLIASAAALLLAGLAACAGTPSIPATLQPAAPRIVALGDVHGDLAATRQALRLAGAIDERDRWIGGDLVVIQTGDQLDRGDQERAILHMFDRLTREAAAAGGAFHVLNGNHELMNVQLDLRYVTDAGFREFAGRMGGIAIVDTSAADPLMAMFPPEQRARVAAFRPGGPYARMLARRNTIMMVGDNLFVHGGVLPEHATYGLDAINTEIRAFLRGEVEAPAVSEGDDSPVWTRLFSQNVDDAACTALGETLAITGARRMIVGHTPHQSGIASYCDDRVWVVDVGMAAYYGGVIEVLEIRGDDVRAIRVR